MKLQKMIVTNKDLSEFNSLQIAVNAKYYIECKTDSDIEEAFKFIKKMMPNLQHEYSYTLIGTLN